MVYESDFYTTRRPYHRPTVTSYSVTNSRLTPAVGQAHTYHPSIPFIAHRKLTNVTTPVPHNQVRKSVISNTLDRIQHRPRSLQSYDPMEDFLNERSVTSFEDVTRSIRANTAALLKQVNTPVPRAVRPSSVSNLYNHTETAIADRISSDEYIWHLLRPLPGKPSNGIDVGYYPESSTRIPLGKTHLACLSYAGRHPISKRRQLVAGAGDDYRNVRNDVELLSHYSRMRQAADLPHVNGGVRNETSNDGGSRFKYNATTTPHTTNEVIANGTSSASDDDKENIAANYQKPLKKKPSKEPSVDEDRLRIEQENAIKAKKAEEERLEQERQERIVEEERKAEEERLERKRKAEEERLEQERKAEEERLEQEHLEQERKAEEERLEQERLAEEERLEQERIAEEEEQRLLEEKLVEEYHREQEKLAEEQRIRELEYAEEQQRQAQEKLVEEQQLLLDKLMEIKQKQEAEEEDVEDEEKEEETEQSTAAEDEVEEKAEENDSEHVTCNNIPKDEAEIKNDAESAESEVSDEEEPAIAENVQQNGSIEIEEIVQVKYSVKSSVEQEYNVKKTEEDDEKSDNTDANSEISETEEPNNSTVPELNHTESKENDEVQNDSKENEEESEEEEEDEEDEEEE